MSRQSDLVSLNDDPLVDWTREPRFAFESEVDALLMLRTLGDELQMAREHEAHVMRYLEAAVRAAADVVEYGERISRQAIIAESGLSRRTVYEWLGENDEEQRARAEAIRRRIAQAGGTAGVVDAARLAAIQRRAMAQAPERHVGERRTALPPRPRRQKFWEGGQHLPPEATSNES